MLRWAAIFFIIALVAGLFGFTGIAAGAASIAKILFMIFLVLFLVALIAGVTVGKKIIDQTTNYLIKNRTEFLDIDKLKSYGIC